MEQTFTVFAGARRDGLTDDEIATAEELVRTKFTTEEWLQRLP